MPPTEPGLPCGPVAPGQPQVYLAQAVLVGEIVAAAVRAISRRPRATLVLVGWLQPPEVGAHRDVVLGMDHVTNLNFCPGGSEIIGPDGHLSLAIFFHPWSRSIDHKRTLPAPLPIHWRACSLALATLLQPSTTRSPFRKQ